MLDRVLERGLNLVVVGLITLVGGGGLVLLLSGLQAGLAGRWTHAGSQLVIGAASAFGAWWLCRHREALQG